MGSTKENHGACSKAHLRPLLVRQLLLVSCQSPGDVAVLLMASNLHLIKI